MNDPEKYFTEELLNRIDEVADKEFSYGKGDDAESGTDDTQQRKLKDNWFSLVPNPDDPEDKNFVFKSLKGHFHHVIVRYKNFQLHKKLNEDGSINCDFEYDILMAPSTIGENHLTDEQGSNL